MAELDATLKSAMVALGKRLRERRKTLGMGQDAVAKAFQANPLTIGTYENGRVRLSPSKIDRLATILKTTRGDLMKGLQMQDQLLLPDLPPAKPPVAKAPAAKAKPKAKHKPKAKATPAAVIVAKAVPKKSHHKKAVPKAPAHKAPAHKTPAKPAATPHVNVMSLPSVRGALHQTLARLAKSVKSVQQLDAIEAALRGDALKPFYAIGTTPEKTVPEIWSALAGAMTGSSAPAKKK